jgi:hypothetical protein
MSALSGGQERRSPIEAVSRWWQDWIGTASASSELRCCGEDEVERMAKDMNVSSAELRRLASRGPRSADLLPRRMAALDLDRNEVARIEPRTFQDLQKVCTLCESRRRCTRDLGRDAADPVWQDYCPNAATLMALNALPWAARREW